MLGNNFKLSGAIIKKMMHVSQDIDNISCFNIASPDDDDFMVEPLATRKICIKISSTEDNKCYTLIAP